MIPVDDSKKQASEKLSVLRHSVLGPLLFGMIFGGIPFGILLGILGLGALSTKLLEWLSAIAIILAAVSANLSVSRSLYRILSRAFLTSLGICVPLPTIVWTVLALHAGYEISDPRNFAFIVALFFSCAVMITIPSWALALVFENLKT